MSVKMTYTAIDIAKYIITFCHKKGRPISNLKLQKVLYYAWVEFYKRTGKELYLDDICAWQLGPVVTNVYYQFCTYAGTPIPNDYEIYIGDEDAVILDEILNKYCCISASTLVNKTHEKGTPWDLVFQHGIGNRDIIPFSLIKEKECSK